jgi:pyruvate dehydrogenase E1 component alpha subunit
MVAAAELIHLEPENMDPVRVLESDGTTIAQYDPGLTPAECVSLYRRMIFTRQIDERLVGLQRQGRIGFHIGSLGEEAAIIGSAFAMGELDWVFPCYREFGAALLRGFSLQGFMDNMFGNANDAAKGRQMPDHYTCRDARWGSISSPIGTQITQAVGLSWAAKLRKDPVSALVYFGDGSTSSSEFHNGMNFAGVYKTPTVFFCRNNGWAISVPVEKQTASKTFAEKGVAYGIPGVRVDGNDVLACVAVTRAAQERALAGEGPTLIEAITYRMGGHSTSDDPARYVPTDSLDPWVGRDPIQRFRHHLEVNGLWDDAKEESARKEYDEELRAAIGAAEKTERPALATMFEDVFAEPTWNLVEQREELLRGPRAPKH